MTWWVLNNRDTYPRSASFCRSGRRISSSFFRVGFPLKQQRGERYLKQDSMEVNRLFIRTAHLPVIFPRELLVWIPHEVKTGTRGKGTCASTLNENTACFQAQAQQASKMAEEKMATRQRLRRKFFALLSTTKMFEICQDYQNSNTKAFPIKIEGCIFSNLNQF